MENQLAGLEWAHDSTVMLEWAHDSTVMLAINLTTFCGIFSAIGPQLGPPHISDKF